MKNLAQLGLIGLAYGGIMVMSAADAPRDGITPEAKAAAKQAGKAGKALARHQADVEAAEQAVALAPREAGYRLLLGQSYLQAGRFRSATQAFIDTLQLDGGNGRAALNLALAQVANGDWQAARQTLAAHGEIPAGDRGLAMALAGDTTGAVQLLTEVARSPEASAKVRQNLALAYALAGQWQAARMVAAADLSPADVDARLEQWAAFAQPRAASDQVAALLGVRPSADGGQPVALALNAPAPAAPVAVAMAGVAPTTVSVATAAPAIRFAAPHEVVQPLAMTMAAPLIQRAAGPIKVAARATAVRPIAAKAGGTWYVQLGAFDNAGVAKDAWGRAQRRYAAFRAHQPQGMSFTKGTATFYRLSVGGFARADAVGACRAYRARGGVCFVRAGAGDQVASWLGKGRVQVASR